MSAEIKTSPEMKKFFEKLLNLKEFVYKASKDADADPIISEIYKKLDEAIKEKKK